MLTSVRGLLAATFAASSVMLAAPVLAQAEAAESPITLSGHVAVTSDYRFRCVSLSGGAIALQGGIDLTTIRGVGGGASYMRFHGVSRARGDFALPSGMALPTTSGFCGGTWGSSSQSGTHCGELERDVYAGWTGAVAAGVTVDGGRRY